MSVSLRVYSLRRRLLALLIAVVASLWSVSAVVAFSTAHREADELFDAQLVQVAETLLAIVAAGHSANVAAEMAEHQHAYRLPLAFQAWQQDGEGWRLIVRSSEMPDAPAVPETGFDEHELHGELWRFFAVDHTHSAFRVIVGQNHQARYRLAGEISLHLLLPILIGLPLISLAIWAVVGRALRPVDAVADQVAQLDVRSLSPLRMAGPVPREIAPLVDSLNALVERLAAALDGERRFTADAAHELRTPLAAIQIQAQVAQRAGGDEARRHALDQVLKGVERMHHLVAQLLTLARLDPEAGAANQLAATPLVDLAEVAELICSDVAPQALRRGQSLSLEGDGGFMVRGNPRWLEVLLRNLVVNALRYSPPGARIVVGLDPAGRFLRVADDGPGIAPELHARLLTRFARGSNGDLDGEGCGLGLSIVARIAAILRAGLRFEAGLSRADGGAGLGVVVEFPPPG